MANGYYSPGTPAVRYQLARAADVNAEFLTVEDGFDKLPTETQLKTDTTTFQPTDTGAADAYVIATPHPQTEFTDGWQVVFLPANTNTGASTINVDSLGVKAIKSGDGTALVAGEIVADAFTILRYHATAGEWRLIYSAVSISDAITDALATALCGETITAADAGLTEGDSSANAAGNDTALEAANAANKIVCAGEGTYWFNDPTLTGSGGFLGAGYARTIVKFVNQGFTINAAIENDWTIFERFAITASGGSGFVVTNGTVSIKTVQITGCTQHGVLISGSTSSAATGVWGAHLDQVWCTFNTLDGVQITGRVYQCLFSAVQCESNARDNWRIDVDDPLFGEFNGNLVFDCCSADGGPGNTGGYGWNFISGRGIKTVALIQRDDGGVFVGADVTDSDIEYSVIEDTLTDNSDSTVYVHEIGHGFLTEDAITIKEDDSAVVTSAVTFDFTGGLVAVVDQGGGEGQITIGGDLGDLDNVSEAGANSGDALVYNGSSWAPGTQSIALNDLSDVSTAGAITGQVLGKINGTYGFIDQIPATVSTGVGGDSNWDLLQETTHDNSTNITAWSSGISSDTTSYMIEFDNVLLEGAGGTVSGTNSIAIQYSTDGGSSWITAYTLGSTHTELGANSGGSIDSPAVQREYGLIAQGLSWKGRVILSDIAAAGTYKTLVIEELITRSSDITQFWRGGVSTTSTGGAINAVRLVGFIGTTAVDPIVANKFVSGTTRVYGWIAATADDTVDGVEIDLSGASNGEFLIYNSAGPSVTTAAALVAADIGTTVQAGLDVPSQAEAEAGTATTERVWTAQRVAQAIAALGGGSGSGGWDDEAEYVVASASDDLQILGLAADREYEIKVFSAVPVSDGTSFEFQVTTDNGMSWKATAYSRTLKTTLASTGSMASNENTNGSSVVAAVLVGNAADEGGVDSVIRFHTGYDQTSRPIKFRVDSVTHNQSTVPTAAFGGGHYNTTGVAIDGLRFGFGLGTNQIASMKLVIRWRALPS